MTAGSASGITDGAASLVIAGDEAILENGLKPLARIVSWARVGCDPSIMGIGPVDSIRNALKAANLTLEDMDLVEINEAFAAQFLACAKELELDMDKCNLNGGAISLGHPLGSEWGTYPDAFDPRTGPNRKEVRHRVCVYRRRTRHRRGVGKRVIWNSDLCCFFFY